MKLIHCSDLHLDSRMESNLSFKQAQERNNEICTTFSRMVSYAGNHNVSVIMIAGDLFDTERISSTTSSYILDIISQANDIDFLYLRGNHDESDRAFAGRDLPKNLKLFSDTWTYYQYNDITISGVELTAHNCRSIYQNLSLSPDKTNFVMMHGQVSTEAGPDLICIPSLRGKNINYLALGHLHSYQQKKFDLNADYCYCGCLEGRGFDECGEKGFVLINSADHWVQTQFIPFAKRTLYDIPVDISQKETIAELQQAIAQAAEGISSDSLVKFTLQGTYTLDTQKDLPFLLKLFRDKYYFVKFKDESRLYIDKGSYENDISLKGEFIRSVMSSSLSDEEKDKIICTGIQALSGEEITL